MYNKIQMQALREITSATEHVKRELENIRQMTVVALRRMEDGNNPGHGWGSPIGHQAPSDLERYTERLQNMCQQAQMLGIETEHIQDAYNMGVAALLSPYREELYNKLRELADEA